MNHKDKKQNSNSVRLKWQVSRCQSSRPCKGPEVGIGGNPIWLGCSITSRACLVWTFSHLCDSAGLSSCHFHLYFPLSSGFGDFLCENTCLLPVLLMLFTWTVVNHQGKLEMHARICTGSPKNKIQGFPPTVAGVCLYSLPTSVAEMIIFTRKLYGSYRALKLTLENRIYLKKNLWNQFKLKKEMETDVCWEMWGKCPWVLINALWDQCYPDKTHLVLVTSHKASVRKNGKTYVRNNGSFSFLNEWKFSHCLTDWIGKFWYKWRWLTFH